MGFTVSRKVGSAVERNRVRRRLKAIARIGQAAMRPGHDYVFVGRRAALDLPFERMKAELDRALRRIHATRAGGARQE